MKIKVTHYTQLKGSIRKRKNLTLISVKFADIGTLQVTQKNETPIKNIMRKNGEIKRGFIKEVAENVGLHPQTVGRFFSGIRIHKSNKYLIELYIKDKDYLQNEDSSEKQSRSFWISKKENDELNKYCFQKNVPFSVLCKKAINNYTGQNIFK